MIVLGGRRRGRDRVLAAVRVRRGGTAGASFARRSATRSEAAGPDRAGRRGGGHRDRGGHRARASVGDSLRASVRRSAVTQLGPVDEEVLTTGIGRRTGVCSRRSPGRRSAVTVSTLPLLSLSTTVVGRDFVARVAQAQVLEVDFAQAGSVRRRPGGDRHQRRDAERQPRGDRRRPLVVDCRSRPATG